MKTCKCGGRMVTHPNVRRTRNGGEVVNVRVCAECSHRVERRVRRSALYWTLQKVALKVEVAA